MTIGSTRSLHLYAIAHPGRVGYALLMDSADPARALAWLRAEDADDWLREHPTAGAVVVVAGPLRLPLATPGSVRP